MLGYKLLYLVSLITYTFGALTFSVLVLFYWRERRLRGQPGAARRVFAIFSQACLAAFLFNLLLEIVRAQSADPRWEAGLLSALDLAAGLLPPLLLHLIYAEEAPHLPARRFWSRLVFAFYLLAAGSALARALDDSELIQAAWSGWFDNMPSWMLGATGAMGLLLLSLSRRVLKPVERRQRRWNAVLLCAMLLGASAGLVLQAPLLNLLPDYLVLGFFCVTLYYKERLVFFDLLIKRGGFFAVALVGLTLFFLIAPHTLDRLSQDWSRPWIGALLLLPFWLMGPWIYARLEWAIDRLWLRRRYTPAEAERQFARDVQPSETEEDLRCRAAASLRDIFQSHAEVLFDAAPAPVGGREDGLLAELELNGACAGWMILDSRPNSIPFMSDDRRLLQSLARTLGVVLDNVRFRERQQRQEEREQQLRLLMSRAELKALRAQINPHFLFNALNAIAGLIPVRPELADETVEQLAEVFRYTLRKAENEWVRLDEEIEFVAAYLRVEQARFGDRLQVEFEVEPAAAAIAVPAMTIQPLIENAIKHGVSALEGRAMVRLRAVLRGELLSIEVFDNGPGFPPGFTLEPGTGQQAGGHALRNIADRLTGYYGNDARLTWESAQHCTRVFLTIPHLPLPDFAGEKRSGERA
jgi:signal transduction histidine kinase